MPQQRCNERSYSVRMHACNRVSVALITLLLTSRPGFSQSLVFNETAPQFGSVVVGASAAPKIISVSNNSGAPLIFTQITVTSEFAQTNNCPMWLVEGAACLVSITFAPVAVGTRSGALLVAAKDAAGIKIRLAGVGIRADTEALSTPPAVQQPIRTTNNEER